MWMLSIMGFNDLGRFIACCCIEMMSMTSSVVVSTLGLQGESPRFKSRRVHLDLE